MNDSEVHRELARDPPKMFIPIGKESIKREFAHIIERMERQLQQTLCIVRSRCNKAPVVVQSNDETG